MGEDIGAVAVKDVAGAQAADHTERSMRARKFRGCFVESVGGTKG